MTTSTFTPDLTTVDLTAVDPIAADLPTPEPAPSSAASPDYHRLARTQANYRWWRPLVTLVVSVASYVAMLLLVFISVAIAVLVNPQLEASLGLMEADTDFHNPFQFMAAMGTLIPLIPAVLIGVAAGRRPVGTILSVAGRLRWRLLGRSLAICLGVYVIAYLAILIVDGVTGELIAPTWHPYSWWLIVGALVIVPFQAAAEEFAFRGLPMQVFGGWLRNPWWGILAPLPLFVIMHNYNTPGLISVAGFALAAGVLVWRTGGLEAAIALHVVNNSLSFVFGAIGWGDLNATDVATVDSVLSLAVVAVCTVLILWVERSIRPRTISPASQLHLHRRRPQGK